MPRMPRPPRLTRPLDLERIVLIRPIDRLRTYSPSFPSVGPRRKVRRERHVEILVGSYGDVVDVDHPATLFHLGEKRADLGLVGSLKGVRLGEELGQSLE